jgi:biopolymer transport protein ExbD
MTALIDLVFILLIFFMVTTSFKLEQQINLSVNAESSASFVDNSGRNLNIMVLPDSIAVNNKRVEMEEFRKIIRAQMRLYKQDANFTLDVKSGATVQEMMDIIATIKIEGGVNISLNNK